VECWEREIVKEIGEMRESERKNWILYKNYCKDTTPKIKMSEDRMP